MHVIYNWAGNVELGDICFARYTIVSMCTAFPDLVTIIANNCVARAKTADMLAMSIWTKTNTNTTNNDLISAKF